VYFTIIPSNPLAACENPIQAGVMENLANPRELEEDMFRSRRGGR